MPRAPAVSVRSASRPQSRPKASDTTQPPPSSSRPLKVRVLLGRELGIGPGKADLLEAIAETGSISGAARRMRMSYRRAWSLVARMNQAFREPLVETATGGSHGGGAVLTPFGREVLVRYRAMEHKARMSVEGEVESFRRLLRSGE